MSNNIPSEYADYYYLRSIDLVPERLGDITDRSFTLEECRNLRRHGWLFMEYKHAAQAREFMLTARILESIKIKGASSIMFDMITP